MNFLTKSRPQRRRRRCLELPYAGFTGDSRGDADSNFQAQTDALETGKETANLLSAVTKAYFGNSRE